MKFLLHTISDANNYGAILQTYATIKFLSLYGDTELIKHPNNKFSSHMKLIRGLKNPINIKQSLHDALRFNSRRKAIKKFKEFSNKYFPAVDLDQAAKESENRSSIYVAGSDQIWNPSITGNQGSIDLSYFLDFAPTTAQKISLSSSSGNYIFNEKERKIIKPILFSFDFLSTREIEAQNQINDILEKPKAHHFPDPTLLLPRHEWDLLLKHYPNQVIHYRYSLTYSVPRAASTHYALKKLSRITDTKSICIDQSLKKHFKSDVQIRDAGPIDFLNYFRNAEYIVTDSFHGVCFSLIFNKPFLFCSSGNLSNRARGVLEKFNQLHRLVDEKTEDELYEHLIQTAPNTIPQTDKWVQSSIRTFSEYIENQNDR